MSILEQVNNSADTKEGLRIVISGVEKVGKTTLACDAPDVLLVPLEIGYSGVKVQKTPMLESFDSVMQLLDEITFQAQQGIFPYKSLVFDSATALERLIHAAVLSTDPNFANGNRKGLVIENALGGYGKAYDLANEYFDKFLKKCDLLAIHGGINIILTCHVFSTKMVDPTAGQYDSWNLLLHTPKDGKKHGKREMLAQWADIIGFLHEPIVISEANNLSRGISTNKGRILAITRTPSYTAGNRCNITNDISVPRENSWNHLAQSIYDSSGLDVFKR